MCLTILDLAMSMHMSTLHQDFPQRINNFQQGGLYPQAPPL